MTQIFDPAEALFLVALGNLEVPPENKLVRFINVNWKVLCQM